MIPVINVNAAPLEELRLLRGVGAVTARRIVEGRPYDHPYSLVSRGLLSENAYDRNVQYLVVEGAETKR